MSIFTKIITGEIPCFKIAEDEQFLAFLDINPLKFGHTLVIPKNEVDYLFDMENEDFTALNLFAKKVAAGVKKIIPCRKIGVAVIGLEVPHAHIHLIPIDNVSDMDFSKPKLKFDDLAMQNLANQIAEVII